MMGLFHSALIDLFAGRINVFDRGVRAMLLTGEYTSDLARDARRIDLAPYEVIGSGYDAGGKVANCRVFMEGDTFVLEFGKIAWGPESKISARYVAYFQDGGADAEEQELLCLVDFGEVIRSSYAEFAIDEQYFTWTTGE